MQGKDAKRKERPSVGLALSGGAARGLAHVGVLRVLIDHGIPIDYIAGTSAGALVGGALAAGLSVDEIEEIGLNLRWRDLGRPTLSRLGMQSNARLVDYVHARFPVTRFEELRIPLATVATDLRAGSAVVMSGEGDIAFAIRASCAIPGWYVPVTDAKGRQLVDGGLVANVPTAAARSLGADIVIAVDVNSEGAKFLGPPQSAIGVMLQAMMVIQRTAAMHQWQDADVVIMPKVGHIRWDEIGRAADLIDAGREATLANLERIKHLTQLAPEPPLKWYQFRRRAAAPQPQDKRRFSPLR
ncbi:MAG TPA: patatin-like phospholipase family protein [Pyrinomonadaceae bacterium]|jgi:NTE family protein|nr:patatin-like phospholipase family protein [Pyrinomonadaceae bacterium]